MSMIDTPLMRGLERVLLLGDRLAEVRFIAMPLEDLEDLLDCVHPASSKSRLPPMTTKKEPALAHEYRAPEQRHPGWLGEAAPLPHALE